MLDALPDDPLAICAVARAQTVHHNLLLWFGVPREGWSSLPKVSVEDPQDGRSHVRSQPLFDFFSLLNHDVAAIDEPDGADYALVKLRTFDELTDEELDALDALAALLSVDPPAAELIAFYRATGSLALRSAELDSYSLVHTG